MLIDILLYAILGIFLFIPIVVWSYIFTSINESVFHKRTFLVWIIIGGFSVLPILYFDQIISWLWFSGLTIFGTLHGLGDMSSYGTLFWLLTMFLVFIVIVSYLIQGSFVRNAKGILKNISILVLFLCMVSFWLFAVQLFFWWLEGLDIFVSQGIYFQGYIFNSLQLVILYYLVVAFLEELSKYISFFSFSQKNQPPHTVLVIVFIALWFAFTENILYISSFISQQWFSWDATKLAIFRSIFSTTLHVLCSIVIYQGFQQLRYTPKTIYVFLLFLIASIVLHSTYDIFLTLWVTLIAFIYLIGGYLYIWNILYHQRNLLIGESGREIG